MNDLYKIDNKLRISIQTLFKQVKKDLHTTGIIFERRGDRILRLYLNHNSKNFFEIKKYIMDNLPFVRKVIYSLNDVRFIEIIFDVDIVTN